MKRPSGFDRLPDRSVPDAIASDSARQPAAAHMPAQEPVSVPAQETAAVAPLKPAPAPLIKRRIGGDPAPDPVAEAERRLRHAARRRKDQLRRESRRFSVHVRKRRRNWFIAFGTVAALALFVAVGVFTPLMSVRTVQVEGAVGINVVDVEKALSKFEGVPLALVQDAAVREALTSFPGIERYSFELIPPSTLKVYIEERVPVLSVEKDGAFHIYDAAGVLLGTAAAAPEGVPLASGAAAERNTKAFTEAARVMRDMPPELRAQVVSVTASSGQDVTLVLKSGVEVMWGDAEQTRHKAVVLNSMRGSLGDRPITHIDVSSPEAPVFR